MKDLLELDHIFRFGLARIGMDTYDTADRAVVDRSDHDIGISHIYGKDHIFPSPFLCCCFFTSTQAAAL